MSVDTQQVVDTTDSMKGTEHKRYQNAQITPLIGSRPTAEATLVKTSWAHNENSSCRLSQKLKKSGQKEDVERWNDAMLFDLSSRQGYPTGKIKWNLFPDYNTHTQNSARTRRMNHFWTRNSRQYIGRHCGHLQCPPEPHFVVVRGAREGALVSAIWILI